MPIITMRTPTGDQNIAASDEAVRQVENAKRSLAKGGGTVVAVKMGPSRRARRAKKVLERRAKHPVAKPAGR